LPDAKIIVMLRDPVARAYSHYWHERRLGYENLSFAEAIDAEDDRLAGESARLAEEDGYHSYNHQHFSYVARGCYAPQLKRWLQPFPRQQFLFIESESFFQNSGKELARVAQFLKLPPPGEAAQTLKKNEETYKDDIAPALRRHLHARFAEANRELDSLTQMTWRWNR
jgi:Sulfotransferase domain